MKKLHIPILVIIACIVMGIVDAVIQPGYAIKSAIKIIMFLLIPIVYGLFLKEFNIKNLMKPDKKGLCIALCLGFVIYGVVLGAYWIFKDVFDFFRVFKSTYSM